MFQVNASDLELGANIAQNLICSQQIATQA